MYLFLNSILNTICSILYLNAIQDISAKNIFELLGHYDHIKIFKSNDWLSGSRIMFASFSGKCSMEIYDNENNYINGFNILNVEAKEIIKMLRNSIIR